MTEPTIFVLWRLRGPNLVSTKQDVEVIAMDRGDGDELDTDTIKLLDDTTAELETIRGQLIPVLQRAAAALSLVTWDETRFDIPPASEWLHRELTNIEALVRATYTNCLERTIDEMPGR